MEQETQKYNTSGKKENGSTSLNNFLSSQNASFQNAQGLSPKEGERWNKIIFISIIVLLVVAGILFGSLSLSTQQNPFAVLRKAEIGKTTTEDLDKQLNKDELKEKQILSNKETIYKLNSILPQRPNEIKTENGVAVFERIIIPADNPNAPGHVKISQMLAMFGQPDTIIQGSQFYGKFSSTYIYGKKGLAFIGNSNTNDVYEVHLFVPMTVEEYIKKHGGDIKEGKPVEQL